MAKKEKKEKSVAVLEVGTGSEEDQILSTFGKTFGEGSIMKLNSDMISSVKEFISSGSYKLDKIISNFKGLPVGKMTTITGKKGSGKSTLVAHIIKEAQTMGALCVLFDTEYAFDETRAKLIGVDTEKLLVSQPDHIEQTFAKLEAIVDIAKTNNRLTVIVWDSVAATPTRKEVEGELGEGGHYGEHSKILAAGFRKIMGMLSNNRILFFVINQIKQNINATYGDGNTYIGKNPLDFHSHVMLEIKQVAILRDSEDVPIGIESHVKVSKNRIGAPFKEETMHIMFETTPLWNAGIDRGWEALEIGKQYGRAKLSGSWNEILGPNGEPMPGIIKFYSKNISTLLEAHPGLEEYLVHGTPFEIKKEEE